MAETKVAVVTAGGSGMGADAARRLAADGFQIGVLSSSGKGEALAKEFGGVGVTGSNQSNDDLKRLVDAVMARWGRIDVLVNSGGHGPRGPILDLTDEDWHRGLDVYLMNVIRPTRIVAPIMQKQRSGSIINISTFATFEPDPVFPTSGVFRSGLAAYTKLFADKYAADNVRMNNVYCRASSTACRRKKSSGSASRWAATATARKSRRPSRFWLRKVRGTSPARISVSTAV